MYGSTSELTQLLDVRILLVLSICLSIRILLYSMEVNKIEHPALKIILRTLISE